MDLLWNWCLKHNNTREDSYRYNNKRVQVHIEAQIATKTHTHTHLFRIAEFWPRFIGIAGMLITRGFVLTGVQKRASEHTALALVQIWRTLITGQATAGGRGVCEIYS